MNGHMSMNVIANVIGNVKVNENVDAVNEYLNGK